MLWVKGQGYVVKINEQNFVQSYELFDFFPKGYNPLYICSNTSGDIIYGYSDSTRNSVLSINKREVSSRGEVYNSLKKFEIASDDRWVGMDITMGDEYLVYFAISRVIEKQKNGIGVLSTIFKVEALGNFWNGLYEIKFTELLPQEILKNAHMIRRIKGYNIFLIACFNSIAVIHVDIDLKKMTLMKVFENIYQSSIVDMMMIMDMLFPLPRAEEPENLRYLDFNSELRNLMEDDDRSKELYTLLETNLPNDIVNIYLQPDIRSYKIPVKETSNFALIIGFISNETSKIILAHQGIALLKKTDMNEFEVENTNFEDFDTAFVRVMKNGFYIVGLDKVKNNIIILDENLRLFKTLEAMVPNEIRS